MRALYLVKSGQLAWREIEEPTLLDDTDALVKPLAVARCDLDAAILHKKAPFQGAALHWLRDHLPESIGQRGIFQNAPFKGPYAFGHESVGEVIEVGSAVRNFKPGDRAVVPFQISCGECDFCQRGVTNSCASVPNRSMYGFGALGGHGWGGVLSERIRVPFADAMLVRLPAELDPAALASAGDNAGDGQRCVAPFLDARPRAPVLVVGGEASSVGLYAAALGGFLGSERVDYLDHDPVRLRIAEQAGANAIEAPYGAVKDKYPITVDASADPAGLAQALLACEPGGDCTSVGIYYTKTTPIPLLAMFGAGIHFHTGRVNARAELPRLLELVERGFDPSMVTSCQASWDDAAEALLDPGPKVVIARA